MDVTLQYFDGCPSWRTTDQHLRTLADEFDLRLSYREVTSPDEAAELGFRGSPTVLVGGRDPFGAEGEPVGFACRIYRTPEGPAGSPTLDQLRAALAAAD
jgi:hypothetical protein